MGRKATGNLSEGVSLSIGEKIKSLRKNLNMTQNELCADIITHGMLSHIENGLTDPSFTTLVLLSERLGVSVGYFFDKDADPFIYRKMKNIDEIRKLFLSGEYNKCALLASSLDGYDDETAYIMARCFFFEGMKHYKNGSFVKANELFNKSLEYSAITVYDCDAIESEITECQYLLKHAKGSSAVPAFPIPQSKSESEKLEFELYTYMLNVAATCRFDLAAQIYDTLRFTNKLYKLHINARLSIASYNNKRAITLLSELLELLNTPENTDIPFKLRVLADLENAYKGANDYRGAYECMQERLSIIENKD